MMRAFGRRSGATRWARFMLKCGLLLTDAKVWESISNQLRDRVGDARDEAKRTYDETTDRLQDAQDALHGRRHWLTPAVNFFGGIGVGVGLGLLLAPSSGEETRSALRTKVVDMKNKVGDVAANVRSRAMESTAS